MFSEAAQRGTMADLVTVDALAGRGGQQPQGLGRADSGTHGTMAQFGGTPHGTPLPPDKGLPRVQINMAHWFQKYGCLDCFAFQMVFAEDSMENIIKR